MADARVADVLAGNSVWTVVHGVCPDAIRAIPDQSIDAIVSDPIYPEVDRHYGRISEADWHVLMRGVVAEARRVLKPTGSAVFILQPNSERVGRMRPWLWEFMAWTAREWNQVQDAWWWNITAMPVGGAPTAGLMRPSVKAMVWLGPEDCFRNQCQILWTETEANKAERRANRQERLSPSGLSMRSGRASAAAEGRGGVTPYNVLPMSNGGGDASRRSLGHGAKTPYSLAAWWIRYISPPGGIILDPFGGEGTMAEAARDQGRRCILIEKDEDSVARCHAAMARPPRGSTPARVPEGQLSLLGGAA